MGIILVRKPNVVSSSRQQSEQPATARVRARRVPFLAWIPGVRVESRRPRVALWRPPASKLPCAKSFVSGQNPCKRLIFLKWHGRGREFESHQVHQNIPQHFKHLRGLLALFLSVEEVARSKARSKHGPKFCFPQMPAWYGSDRVSSPPNRTDSIASWYAW